MDASHVRIFRPPHMTVNLVLYKLSAESKLTHNKYNDTDVTVTDPRAHA